MTGSLEFVACTAIVRVMHVKYLIGLVATPLDAQDLKAKARRSQYDILPARKSGLDVHGAAQDRRGEDPRTNVFSSSSLFVKYTILARLHSLFMLENSISPPLLLRDVQSGYNWARGSLKGGGGGRRRLRVQCEEGEWIVRSSLGRWIGFWLTLTFVVYRYRAHACRRLSFRSRLPPRAAPEKSTSNNERLVSTSTPRPLLSREFKFGVHPGHRRLSSVVEPDLADATVRMSCRL